MARIPEGAVLDGDAGFPTVRFRNVHILPGVPRLVRGRFAAFEDQFRGPPVHCQSVWTMQGESESVEAVEGVVSAHPDVEIGSYPQWGRDDVRVILTVEGTDVDLVTAATNSLAGALDPDRLVRIERDHPAEAVDALG
jgi:molybdopterin-biosynthesis enzyme MoeA-like protein